MITSNRIPVRIAALSFFLPPSRAVTPTCRGYMVTAMIIPHIMIPRNGSMILKHQPIRIKRTPILMADSSVFFKKDFSFIGSVLLVEKNAGTEILSLMEQELCLEYWLPVIHGMLKSCSGVLFRVQLPVTNYVTKLLSFHR